MQPKFITSPSFDQLHNATLTIVKEARTLAWIDAVLAPVRGGLLFGMGASYKLNVPLIPVHYSSKVGNGDNKVQSNTFPILIPDVKTVMLVDDIADSGNTLKEITEHYTQLGVKVISAVYHYKESSGFHPNFYFWRIPADSEFIVYPYE